METNRLEAFSDGVLAIIITVMVLELKVPHGTSLHDLWKYSHLSLITYLLSFIYIGIYWNNHHHLFQLCGRITGGVMWANLHLLFWLSLYPFTTNWMDETHLALTPTVVYGVNLLGAAIAYTILQALLLNQPETGQQLREALGADFKGKISPVLYLTGIGLAFVEPWLGLIPFAVVAGIWLIPDRRVERYLSQQQASQA
ncbi:MAG: TMEM175 family protein [Marmoricola sp.]